ncbi:tyrosine/serine protein phosphatase [Lasiosphaeria miniovina]|uniref:Tyrosine/serine protein phosphatase n=1 Tax=Lasiosphaeria miniovina TaxID=1954250 RepID=A0AA40B418_9PEZI|nr:tyrosine/serine protein phosphatase [Lasiosphaeria miniovina]KAK0727246.1 tyrosine/serine protein phosphatase [Lasiosphaeria miniovina]
MLNGGLTTILNFRDVGKTINTFLGQRLVREGLFFRSARPDDATPGDRRRLTDEFGIRTVIDLRTTTEHINAAKKHQAELQATLPPDGAPNGAAAAELAEPLKIPGLRYLEIKLTGRRFERFLLSQLTWWSLVKFLFLFAFGYRMPAIAILGREVMKPRGIVGLGLDTIDQSGPEIAETLESLLGPSGVALPALVHCTQGKDRTGVIVMLVLMILGIPQAAIDFDYRLTDEALLPEKTSRLAEISEIGLPAEFAETSEVLIKRSAEHLDTKYGGLDGYLDEIGFDHVKRERLQELLSY